MTLSMSKSDAIFLYNLLSTSVKRNSEEFNDEEYYALKAFYEKLLAAIQEDSMD